jgi:hypothetical protein
MHCLAAATANSMANATFRRCSNPYRKWCFSLRNTVSIARASPIACRSSGVSDAQEGLKVRFVEHKCKHKDEIKALRIVQDGSGVQLNQTAVICFSVSPTPYEPHALWQVSPRPRGFLSRNEIRPELRKGCYRSGFSYFRACGFKSRLSSVRQFRAPQ